jgi:hypothetical protein
MFLIFSTGFKDVWNGTGQEALVSGLLPGHGYNVRVCAINSAGQGPFSEPIRVGTAPAPPGAPIWTRKQPAPSAHSLTVQWGKSTALLVCCIIFNIGFTCKQLLSLPIYNPCN